MIEEAKLSINYTLKLASVAVKKTKHMKAFNYKKLDFWTLYR